MSLVPVIKTLIAFPAAAVLIEFAICAGLLHWAARELSTLLFEFLEFFLSDLTSYVSRMLVHIVAV